jgi:hypothetical protein
VGLLRPVRERVVLPAVLPVELAGRAPSLARPQLVPSAGVWVGNAAAQRRTGCVTVRYTSFFLVRLCGRRGVGGCFERRGRGGVRDGSWQPMHVGGRRDAFPLSAVLFLGIR